MNRIQNEINKVRHEQRMLDQLHEAQLRQIKKESDGLHKWVVIKRNLSLLCRIDDKGELLPREKERIKRVKKVLGIK